MKYSNLYTEYEDNKKYTTVLENSLKKLKALKNEEKDISKDEHSQTAQESQSAIKEVNDEHNLSIEYIYITCFIEVSFWPPLCNNVCTHTVCM